MVLISFAYSHFLSPYPSAHLVNAGRLEFCKRSYVQRRYSGVLNQNSLDNHLLSDMRRRIEGSLDPPGGNFDRLRALPLAAFNGDRCHGRGHGHDRITCPRQRPR